MLEEGEIPPTSVESACAPAEGVMEVSSRCGTGVLKQRLLLCAPSNTAVDELLTRLIPGVLDHRGEVRPVRIVRLGEPLEGASPQIQEHTLDAQIEVAVQREAVYDDLLRAKERIRDIERELRVVPPCAVRRDAAVSAGAGTAEEKKWQETEKRLRNELIAQRRAKVCAEMNVDRARGYLRRQILMEADVVCATLSGSGRKQFMDLVLQDDVVFDTTIIDEAAQTTEPSCLIPLRLGCRRLVLVGDPRQLPATVLSSAASSAGLGRSLFERLERADHEVVMLTIQYRMHPGSKLPTYFTSFL
jgi:senataxin